MALFLTRLEAWMTITGSRIVSDPLPAKGPQGTNVESLGRLGAGRVPVLGGDSLPFTVDRLGKEALALASPRGGTAVRSADLMASENVTD